MSRKFDIPDSDIVKAFYLSKSTVVNEVEQSDFEYTYMRKPEFYEFLGRLAWLKYKNTYMNLSWSLYQKTKVLLDDLFKAFLKTPCIEPPA